MSIIPPESINLLAVLKIFVSDCPNVIISLPRVSHSQSAPFSSLSINSPTKSVKNDWSCMRDIKF